MPLIKLPYYLQSSWQILSLVKNHRSLMDVLINKPTIIILKNDLSFKVASLLDFIILKETIYDDAYGLTQLVNPHCIIDVGAGWGDFAIFASFLFPKSRILAFEPHPILFKYLLENISLNARTNIFPYPYALGEDTHINLLSDRTPTQSSIFTKQYADKKYNVASKRLDLFIKEPIDLLKIDCEGSELAVLNSISKEKMGYMRKIALEYHNHIVAGIDQAIVNKLKKNFTCRICPDFFNPQIGYIYAENIV